MLFDNKMTKIKPSEDSNVRSQAKRNENESLSDPKRWTGLDMAKKLRQ
jgi:hypothetical protein